MGVLGNIGGIETARTFGIRDPLVDRVDREMHRSSKETRLCIEKLEAELVALRGLIQSITGPAGPPGPPGTPGADGSSPALPSIQNLPFPFVVTSGIVVPPTGIGIFSASKGFRIVKCEIHCDPEGPVATANTTFTLQNAASSPTATGAVTVISGTREGHNYSMNVPISVGQRIFLKAPAALNGVQNLWALHLEFDKL